MVRWQRQHVGVRRHPAGTLSRFAGARSVDDTRRGVSDRSRPVVNGAAFKAGHRLRVLVTSSDFPRYDRNLNTGGPFAEEEHSEVATNTIFHDATRASYVSLPILRHPTLDSSSQRIAP
jgi:predicted acyl esterase